MKRLFACVLACLLLLGCAAQKQPEQTRYTATYLTLFDTVTTIVGFAESEAAFTETVQTLHDQLLHYHRLFDIYNSYEGLVNLKTVNDRAGEGPVTVDPEIIALLADCKQFYEASGGTVNAAMGSVLKLWHEARNDSLDDPANAYLPDPEALTAASAHMDFDQVILDEEKGTVYFADPELRLDVGAIAKGWSVQRVCEKAPSGLLISVGGNVCATGPKAGDVPWVVGIQNPDGSDAYLHTLTVPKGSVVTSGDYQRAFVVDGEIYHHIIDPDTLYPSEHWRSVTILVEDSGLGDMLSTALFVLPLEEGKLLVSQYGAEAMWVDRDGNRFYSEGFEEHIRT